MIAVVADSAASLPRELASELGIEVVPLYLRFGDRMYRDGVDIEDFYGRLARHDAAVGTSAPAPGDFLRVFESGEAEEVLCITVSESVSGAHRAAVLAARGTERRVEVIDSGSASMGQGFVAVEAARAARDGASLEAVADRAREVAGRVGLVATIDTFEYLRRSGRVNRLQAYAATKLRVKPVFRMHRGRIDPGGRPRTRGRALARVAEIALREVGDRPVHLAAVHAAAEGEARELLARVAGEADVREAHLAEFTTAMGAHTGPGVVGLAYWCE